MKKRVLLILIAVSAVTVSLAAYYKSNGGETAPQFTTAAVTRGDVVDAVEATGTLQAVTTVQVGTQISGTIQSLHADFNTQVRKGQILARLDPSVLQAQVDQAEATIVRLQADVARARVSLEDAQVKLRRARELTERQLIPRADLETAEAVARQADASLTAAKAQVTQAMASLSQNKVNLSHSIITAPVDGIVISRNVDVGQTVAASMSAPTLFVLAQDLAEMQVKASIDESDIGRIKSGQRVTFRVDAYPREAFTGTVSQVRLEPIVQQNVVSYVTMIDVANPGLKLKPGMTATVTVEIARADDVIRVPNAALRFRPPTAPAQTGPAGDSEPRGPRVWIVREGQLQPVRVRPGISDGTATAILEGELTENAQVATGIATTAAGAASPATSPLMPFGGRRPGGPGGTGGGAAGRGAPRGQGAGR